MSELFVVSLCLATCFGLNLLHFVRFCWFHVWVVGFEENYGAAGSLNVIFSVSAFLLSCFLYDSSFGSFVVYICFLTLTYNSVLSNKWVTLSMLRESVPLWSEIPIS